MKLKGKVAIVTGGGASGIGKAISELFLKEVAKGALFLASDDSSFMTGSHLLMDGGIVAKE